MELSHAVIGVVTSAAASIPRSVTLDGVKLPGVIKNAVVNVDAGEALTISVTFYLRSFESVEEPIDG
jgi:hypothetical protein